MKQDPPSLLQLQSSEPQVPWQQPGPRLFGKLNPPACPQRNIRPPSRPSPFTVVISEHKSDLTDVAETCIQVTCVLTPRWLLLLGNSPAPTVESWAMSGFQLVAFTAAADGNAPETGTLPR